MKKILLILVIVAVFVAGILWFTISNTKKQSAAVQQSYQDRGQSQSQGVDDNAVESFTEGLKNSKEVLGVVGTIRIPKEGDVRFFQVNADVVNVDELKNVDFSKNSNELPMKQQTFMVAVDSSSKLVKVDKKEDIKSGDMVKITSGRSVYDAQDFTAVEIEVVATR